MKSILFQDYTRDEIGGLAADGCALVLPLGATEQHGPHLPTGTDSMVCERVALRAAEAASNAGGAKLLLAPLLPIGSSDHHVAYGGTLSISSSTYVGVLRDIGKSAILSGFRKLIFLNGHGGNEHAMHQAAQDLAVDFAVWTASASYWNVARRALSSVEGADAVSIPGHAGLFETSLVLAASPELVKTDRFAAEHPRRNWDGAMPAGAFLGRHPLLTGIDGYTDSPSGATRKLGEDFEGAVVASVADWLTDVYRIMEGDGQP
jgi:creatinine amidohydrolase